MKISKIFNFVLLILVLFASCRYSNDNEQKSVNNIIEFSVFPNSSSLFGNIPIIIKSNFLPVYGDKVTAFIGKHKLYNLYYEKGTLSGFIEGAETPGVKDIVLLIDNRSFILKNAFTYKKLKYPLFKNMYSIGASYTQGFISMGLNRETQLHSPFALLAKQVGAYFPQPLLKKGVFYESKLRDISTNCKSSDLLSIDITKIITALKDIKYKDNEDVMMLSSYRVNPYLQPHNIGIGGSTIQGTVDGAQNGRRPVITLLENLVYNPFVKITHAFKDPPVGSPIDYIINNSPTVVFSTDLYADDILYFAATTGKPVTTEITKVEVIETKLTEIFDKFKERNITAYIANMPDITIMAMFKYYEKIFYQNGFTDVSINKWRKSVQILTAKYSKVFTAVANKYDNIHIVDFRGYLKKINNSKGSEKEIKLNDAIIIKNGGILVGKQIFTTDFLGGLLSLDAIHLTYTGYAMITNMFIEQINRDEGYIIPFINLEDVAMEDPLTPDKIKLYNVDVSLCTNQLFVP